MSRATCHPNIRSKKRNSSSIEKSLRSVLLAFTAFITQSKKVPLSSQPVTDSCVAPWSSLAPRSCSSSFRSLSMQLISRKAKNMVRLLIARSFCATLCACHCSMTAASIVQWPIVMMVQENLVVMACHVWRPSQAVKFAVPRQWAMGHRAIHPATAQASKYFWIRYFVCLLRNNNTFIFLLLILFSMFLLSLSQVCAVFGDCLPNNFCVTFVRRWSTYGNQWWRSYKNENFNDHNHCNIFKLFCFSFGGRPGCWLLYFQME